MSSYWRLKFRELLSREPGCPTVNGAGYLSQRQLTAALRSLDLTPPRYMMDTEGRQQSNWPRSGTPMKMGLEPPLERAGPAAVSLPPPALLVSTPGPPEIRIHSQP
ncbi:unnamed protein product [Boreogadus saida]